LELRASERFGVSLLAVAEEIPALRKADLARMDQCADDQRKRVEIRRIEAAREAFAIIKQKNDQDPTNRQRK
jgi:hypothetical protein